MSILHTLTGNAVSSFYVRIWNILDSKLVLINRKKCFSYIIMELLNWYWWILALVGFKMHWQARAFSQPTRANIHQYQFKNPIGLYRIWRLYLLFYFLTCSISDWCYIDKILLLCFTFTLCLQHFHYDVTIKNSDRPLKLSFLVYN